MEKRVRSLEQQEIIRTRAREKARKLRDDIKADPARHAASLAARRARMRAKYETNAAYRAAKQASNKRDREANPEKYKRISDDRQCRCSYGITLIERDALLEAQGNRCVICQTVIAFGKGPFKARAHLDHCHATGAVRGVLCAVHNMALGKFSDNPELLRRAADYLERKL